jgi:hypothetical protein
LADTAKLMPVAQLSGKPDRGFAAVERCLLCSRGLVAPRPRAKIEHRLAPRGDRVTRPPLAGAFQFLRRSPAVRDAGDDGQAVFRSCSESRCEINPFEQVGFVVKGQMLTRALQKIAQCPFPIASAICSNAIIALAPSTSLFYVLVPARVPPMPVPGMRVPIEAEAKPYPK